MKKQEIQILVEEVVEAMLFEHRKELATDYAKHIENNFPELNRSLIRLAKFSIDAVKAGHSPTKKIKHLASILRYVSEVDPRESGDTHGVRLYIDKLAKDNKIAGRAKRWYQTTLDQLLKNQYTKPRKQRERKFKKLLKKARKKKEEAKQKDKQKESVRQLIDDVIKENFDFLVETIRKPFKMAIPADIKMLSKVFNSHGHDLYIVGGAVRDSLLGKTPKDYDLATDANPEQILEIIKKLPKFKTVETGKRFGVINVITPSGEEYEIATFREDIGKGRKPTGVSYTTIDNDVKRRDLTINALFYDINNEEIVDLVGGIDDLQNGIVKTVGDPNERFDEDKLRILRAIRFAARLNTKLDKDTEEAIKKDNSLEGVSSERIRDEFIKSIKSAKSVRKLFKMYELFNLWDKLLPGLSVNLDYQETRNIPVQLALLTRDESNPKSLAKKIVNQLKYNARTGRQVAFLNLFQGLSPENALQLKKLWKLTELTPADLEEFALLNGKPDIKLVKAFIQYEPTVKGDVIAKQGFSGRDIGKELERLEKNLFKKLIK